MPIKIKNERLTEVPEKNVTIDPENFKEIISRAVEIIGKKILEEHTEIKIRGDKK